MSLDDLLCVREKIRKYIEDGTDDLTTDTEKKQRKRKPAVPIWESSPVKNKVRKTQHKAFMEPPSFPEGKLEYHFIMPNNLFRKYLHIGIPLV
jgi:hypothetical protein